MEPPDSMDLRKQPRLETTEPVQVTVNGQSESKLVARIINVSRDGIGLQMSSPIPLGATLKVEWSHTVLLGEVCHCNASEEGFSVGLHVEQAHFDLKSSRPGPPHKPLP